MRLDRFHVLYEQNPRRLALIVFFSAYSLAVFCLFHLSSRDPTSVFFNPRAAFRPRYSEFRKLQADELVLTPNNVSPIHSPAVLPRLAIGIATVQRQGKRYFRTALGSLLEGVRHSERGDFHLTALIANVDPHVHQAYNESWLHELPDRVLTYLDVSDEQRARMSELEVTDVEHRTKPMLDYIYLLQDCYETGAEYIMMLEDDVVAMDGWYHRTLAALDFLKTRQDLTNTIYLRLFFDSGLHGWNSEKWPSHLFWSAIATGVVAVSLKLLQQFSPACNQFLTHRAFLVITFVCTPMVIGLYFAAGRLTVSPLPHGLRRMDTHGCCSQAFVFPRHQIPPLVEYYHSRGGGFIDMLTEDYANANHLARWALVPSVFQHVGATSSKGDDFSKNQWHRSAAQNIWNFEFELFDPDVLRREHDAAVVY